MKPLRIAARFLCAVLFVCVVALWVRSHFASDTVAWKVKWTNRPAAPAQGNSVFGDFFASLRPDTAGEGFSVNRILTTATGRVITYRQSPFA